MILARLLETRRKPTRKILVSKKYNSKTPMRKSNAQSSKRRDSYYLKSIN